jgi:hypothetical protein
VQASPLSDASSHSAIVPAAIARFAALVCTKRDRVGRYRLNRLVENRGRDVKLVDWLDEVTVNCPKKSARN